MNNHTSNIGRPTMTDEEAMARELEFIKSLNLKDTEKKRLIRLWNDCDFLRRQNERMRNKEEL